ncbi:hypothetical protein BJY04DRAFT_218629 [Aspergillus karnatakaensis]|uniref:uncharacterized protein n=1 Tax=Aspergillus karnatakaensis TaxID=1810916 RepID=UPI003CCCC083
MQNLSTEEARRIVDDVRVTNGGLTPQAEQELSEETIRVLRNLQSIAGGSIVHVAQDLYDNDTRFIYELIQNAEDNRYSQAISAQEEPFLHFTLHEDRITVDSNEDGFTEADVRAICSIHHSSKKQTGGYIGHKGIGFKSVFKIASKVTIQSGSFCFSFNHRQGESGMGMITPYNEEHDTLPAGVRTRITLHLINPTDFEARANELKEVPDTLLLFLRKLRKLAFESIPHSIATSYERLEEFSGHRVTLIKKTNGEQHKRAYLFERSTLSNLPEHPSRPGSNDGEVILAFPIDDDSHPLIQPQYVYSFLPMRHEGFNFLIQSDFITQANRLGVHLCPRNYAIRQSICDLFVRTILDFSAISQLKYDWLQYLPGPHIHDPFWNDLREMIFDGLEESKVLLTRQGVLDYGRNLQRLSPRHCDGTGNPLLDDLEPEVYLSTSYNWTRDFDALMELGVTNLSYATILERLKPYLEGRNPRFLNPSLNADWHKRISELLLRGLKRDGRNSAVAERIKELRLVPTVGHSLTAPKYHPTYFPVDEHGYTIPMDLSDLRLACPMTLKDPARRELIEELGVQYASSGRVTDAIFKRYNSHNRDLWLWHSIDHLAYLFRTMREDATLDKRIFIMDESRQRIYRAFVTLGVDIIVDDIYFDTMGEYGTRALCDKLQSSSNVPCYDLHIINKRYIQEIPVGTIMNGRTWEQWLEEVAQVRRVPRLKSRSSDSLSPLAQHLADHYPMTLLGVLKTYSESYMHDFTPKVIQVLSRMRVSCRNDITKQLQNTYFPSQELTEMCAAATVDTIFGRFLDIPPSPTANDLQAWEFLSRLGVKFSPDLYFFQSLFWCLFHKRMSGKDTGDGYFAIYKELFLRRSETFEWLQQLFRFEFVYIPPRLGEEETVRCLSGCLWRGLPCLETRSPLASHPEYSDDPLMVGLFKDLLAVPNASLETYIYELQHRKERFNEPGDEVAEIYGVILEEFDRAQTRDSIRQSFTEHGLIYLKGQQEWVAPTSCVWTDMAKIGSKYGVKAEYPRLRDFFCNTLGIQAPSAANHIEQLRGLISSQPVNIAHVKECIEQINTLSPSDEDLQTLRGLEFLPVKVPNRDVQLLGVTGKFFIADRREYLSAFQDRVPTLDFSLEECHRHRRLLVAMGLDERHMSVSVKEETFVDRPSHECSSRLTRQFRHKARAIYRCIRHYGGSEPTNALRKLQTAKVYESDGFRKTLLLQLDHVRAEVDSDSGLVHIETINDDLQVYIPRAPEEQERCYTLHLPKALRHHFQVQTPEAQLTLQLVFLSPNLLVDQLLDGHGIVEISDVLELPDHDSESVGSQSDEENGFDAGGSNTESSDETATQIFTPVSSPPRYDTEPRERPIFAHHRARTPASRPFVLTLDSTSPEPGQLPAYPEASPYGRLLENVVTLARRYTLSELLEGSPNRVTGLANVAHEDAFGSRSQRQLEHDIKIGAAGELFVFEILLRQELLNFDRTNWRSTIRKHVSSHPDYQDLTPWNGVETADIVYHDSTSSLTSTLINAGHLNGRWAESTPKYFIEVKTTTGECDSAFFMSRAQYRRMERMQLRDTLEDGIEIYLIFRVHHLGKRDMGLQVYVDPESMRQDGRLVFSAESYSVRPGAGTEV